MILFPRRMISLLALGALLLAAWGCSPAAKEPEPDAALADLAAVIKGEKAVTFHPKGALPQEVTVEELPAAFNPDSDYAALWRFAVLDLNGDGQSEAVLQIIDAAGDMGGFVVLCRYDGGIRGYPVGYRYFEDLKEDGTFCYTSGPGWGGGSGWGVGRMEITADSTGGGYSVPHSLWQEPAADPVRWYLQEEETTREKFDAALAAQKQKPDAPWYDYTPEGIALAFPGE